MNTANPHFHGSRQPAAVVTAKTSSSPALTLKPISDEGRDAQKAKDAQPPTPTANGSDATADGGLHVHDGEGGGGTGDVAVSRMDSSAFKALCGRAGETKKRGDINWQLNRTRIALLAGDADAAQEDTSKEDEATPEPLATEPPAPEQAAATAPKKQKKKKKKSTNKNKNKDKAPKEAAGETLPSEAPSLVPAKTPSSPALTVFKPPILPEEAKDAQKGKKKPPTPTANGTETALEGAATGNKKKMALVPTFYIQTRFYLIPRGEFRVKISELDDSLKMALANGKGNSTTLDDHSVMAILETSFADTSFMKSLQSALQFGTQLLVEDVERVDPILLNPVLTRKQGGRVLLVQVGLDTPSRGQKAEQEEKAEDDAGMQLPSASTKIEAPSQVPKFVAAPAGPEGPREREATTRERAKAKREELQKEQQEAAKQRHIPGLTAAPTANAYGRGSCGDVKRRWVVKGAIPT
ncbi:unnamed protein product [Vitrella brassicaformis CCMP3155]|uniref:Dynein heavy chain ATP-binding dynein motor region domain-containing protein n=1 Tax=Vitrella brassicaformis (strain CCMP3155) TaxID=1169540 RepID=A0A0G4GJP3_VITBC|nr:unnamed protein product [Vitrella brassicaformis CCMP3155]|eukprot:CEM30134.1 unnamed protein product [Vitrella brassicaformis CCMP3155]